MFQRSIRFPRRWDSGQLLINQQAQCADLAPEHWENLGSAVAGTGGLIALPDAALRHEAQRFHKVVKTQ